MKKDINEVGNIAVTLSGFAARVEELSFAPSATTLAELRKEILAFAATTEFSKNSLRAQREEVGNLLISILELEDSLK